MAIMLDIDQLLRGVNSVSPAAEDLITVFLSPGSKGRRFVLGRNAEALQLAGFTEIDGLFDDSAAPGSSWHGIPAVRGDELPESAIVVNCSTSIAPLSAQKRIDSLGIAGSLSYWQLRAKFPAELKLPGFVAETRDDVLANRDRWTGLEQVLADAASKRTLADILRYRLTGDPGCMSGYKVRVDEQYFEPFLGLDAGEVFVDGGGFDGSTTAEFCKRYPSYKKAIVFEPSVHSLQRAGQKLAGTRDVELVPMGLSNSVGQLRFNPGDGPASAISAGGSEQITVTTLDQFTDEKLTFIKLDLEGWEMAALRGASRHIRDDRPRLAVAVYHAPADFWQVPDFVLSIRRDYAIFLRHYTEGWSETVMFFVPTE